MNKFRAFGASAAVGRLRRDVERAFGEDGAGEAAGA